ncbi:hypothetical protein MAP00_006511 [Monascus purpureus]|nr:hypothetical protein MAP00_006511 [Monascus purpureus]
MPDAPATNSPLGVESHHVYRLLLGGELQLAPIKDPKRVLDIGTGTGIWDMIFRTNILMLKSSVALSPNNRIESVLMNLGNDLSAIQPTWLPPNCRLEIDDFEHHWEYTNPYDFIHGRELEGCIQDHDRLFRQAFKNLVPGGYFEMASIEISINSDDGTHLEAKNWLHLRDLIIAASEKFGKSLKTVAT